MSLESNLEHLGLRESEITAYLAVLDLGETPLMPVADRTGQPHTSLVYTLERLQEQGLIDIAKRKSRKVYVPKPPRTVVTLLNKKKAELEEQIGTLEDSLPDLTRRYSHTTFLPTVRYFRGQAEIRQAYNQILETFVDEIWYVSEIRKIEEVLGKQHVKAFVKQRINLQIKSKAVWVRSEAVLDEPSYLATPANRRTVRYAPEGFHAPAHTIIYGDNVMVITTTRENVATVITSRDYAKTMRSWFRELWKVSSEK